MTRYTAPVVKERKTRDSKSDLKGGRSAWIHRPTMSATFMVSAAHITPVASRPTSSLLDLQAAA